MGAETGKQNWHTLVSVFRMAQIRIYIILSCLPSDTVYHRPKKETNNIK